MWTQCGCLYNRVQTPKAAWHDVDEGIQTPRRVGTQAWVDHVGTCRSRALEDAPLQKDRVQKGSANLKSSVVVLWVRQCQRSATKDKPFGFVGRGEAVVVGARGLLVMDYVVPKNEAVGLS